MVIIKHQSQSITNINNAKNKSNNHDFHTSIEPINVTGEQKEQKF